MNKDYKFTEKDRQEVKEAVRRIRWYQKEKLEDI